MLTTHSLSVPNASSVVDGLQQLIADVEVDINKLRSELAARKAALKSYRKSLKALNGAVKEAV